MGHEKIEGAINSSFTYLVPKGKNPMSIKHLCPISLCNSSYKIITKIIATEIMKILHKVISPNQRIFLVGKQILDNIIVVQDAIHSSFGRREREAWP